MRATLRSTKHLDESTLIYMGLLQPTDKKNGSGVSSLQACIHLLKGNIGPGCLSLPFAFSRLGVQPAFLITCGIASLTTYNSLLLLRVKDIVWNRERATTTVNGEFSSDADEVPHEEPDPVDNPNPPPPDYPSIGRAAFGKSGFALITLSVLVQQLSVCTVFFSFMADNIVKSIPPDCGLFNQPRFIMALTFPFILLLTSLKNLKLLAPLSVFASSLLLTAFLLVVVGGLLSKYGSDNENDIVFDDDVMATPTQVSRRRSGNGYIHPHPLLN